MLVDLPLILWNSHEVDRSGDDTLERQEIDDVGVPIDRARVSDVIGRQVIAERAPLG